jgi:hypothetical protein
MQDRLFVKDLRFPISVLSCESCLLLLQVPPPLLGKEVRDQLAHAWNSTVDNTLGALVVALSSRGW